MITTSDMKKLEDESEQKGTSKLVLMDRAGNGIAEILKVKFDLSKKRILFVCYHGNNGGDGFTAAQYLKYICDVTVLFIGEVDKLRQEAQVNYNKIKHDEKIRIIDSMLFGEKDPNLGFLFEVDILIDCMLGIGVFGELREPIASVVDSINNSKAYKVAIDIPTGLDPDTGNMSGKCVNADLIITMHDLKPGLEQFRDKVEVVDIGL